MKSESGIVPFWNAIISLGIRDDMVFTRKRSITNLNIVSILCAPFPLGLSLVLNIFVNVPVAVIVLGVLSTISLLLVPVFNVYQNFHVGRMFMNCTITLTLIVDSVYAGGGYGLELPFFVVLTGAFTFNEFNWEVTVYTILAAVGLVTCLGIYYSGDVSIGSTGNFVVHTCFALSSLFFSFVCLSSLKSQSEDYEAAIENTNLALYNQKTELERQHDNLSKLHTTIRDKNEKLGHKNFMITESLNYAKRIQLSTLPDAAKLQKLLGDNFIYYSPKDIVSGDFYWVEEIGSTTYFAVADCTGHGVPGAFMSLLGTTTLHQIAIQLGHANPSSILSELDVRISNQLGHEAHDDYSREGMDIALCALDRKAGKISIASAGRPVFHVRNCQLTEYKGSRVYVGKNFIPDGAFIEHEINLEPGDMIYLFTDGITDQFDRSDRRKFGLSRLRELLPEVFHIDLSGQRELIKDEIEKWKAHIPQTDDILMMGYRYSQKTWT